MYLVIWPNQKKIWKTNSCNNLYKDYRKRKKKRQATKYIIIGENKITAFMLGMYFLNIFIPVEQIAVKI